MKLIKEICLRQKLPQNKQTKKSRKIILTEDVWYMIIMKNICFYVLPDKLNHWLDMKKNIQENVSNSLFSFDRKHELRNLELSCLFFIQKRVK